MSEIRFAFLGCTQFSFDILLELIENKFKPQLVFTIPEEFDISYAKTKKVKNCTYASLEDLCIAHNIPCYSIERNHKTLMDFHDILRASMLDVLFVMGWYYMIPKTIRDLATMGAWGIHASLLPNYAGGAPLVWAMINGEKETGVTLFKLADGVDDGDVIAQERIVIEEEDTIKEVYAKATRVSKNLLINVLHQLPNIKFTPQDKDNIVVYPQRKPEDGVLDLTQSASDLYNFIRAQSSPYPGAFIRTVDGKKLIIEKARVCDL